MSISIKCAAQKVFKDKSFGVNLLFLVILSFLNGLFTFAILAKNIALYIPTFFAAAFASIVMIGYDITYMRNLFNDKDAELPHWKQISKFFSTGFKYTISIILLIMSIYIPLLFILVGYSFFKFSALSPLIIILGTYIIIAVIEVLIITLSLAVTFAFVESEDNILEVFNFKKVFGYINTNYFSALFAVGIFGVIHNILTKLSIANIKYAIIYIVPLIIFPIFRLIIDNIAAQAYHAQKDNEKASAKTILIYLIILAFLFVLAYMFKIIQ